MKNSSMLLVISVFLFSAIVVGGEELQDPNSGGHSWDAEQLAALLSRSPAEVTNSGAMEKEMKSRHKKLLIGLYESREHLKFFENHRAAQQAVGRAS